MTVYVLVCRPNLDEGVQVRVFKSYDKAWAYLELKAAEIKESENVVDFEYNDNGCWIKVAPEEDYYDTEYSLFIEECEVKQYEN